jgi:hypothetical protein
MKITIEVTDWPKMTAAEVHAERQRLETELAEKVSAAERELDQTAAAMGVAPFAAGETCGSWTITRDGSVIRLVPHYHHIQPSLSELRGLIASIPELAAEIQRRIIAAAM